MNNERRIAEEALRESEQRWRSLIEALPQLVWHDRPAVRVGKELGCA